MQRTCHHRPARPARAGRGRCAAFACALALVFVLPPAARATPPAGGASATRRALAPASAARAIKTTETTKTEPALATDSAASATNTTKPTKTKQALVSAAAARATHTERALVSVADAPHAAKPPPADPELERAAALDPVSGEALLLLGLARFERGERSGARAAFALALARRLETPGRALASTYLELLALPPQVEKEPWSLSLRAAVGAGVDSNARLAPIAGTDTDVATAFGGRGDAFATSAVSLGVAGPLGAGSTELTYSFFNVAYVDEALEDHSFHEHAAEWMNQLTLGRLRLRLPLRADLSYTGLRRGLRPFQWSAGLEPEVAWRHFGRSRLRVGLAWTTKRGFDQALAALDGQRWELLATEELDLGGVPLSLSLRHRWERLGESIDDARAAETPRLTVVPHSYRALLASLRIAAPHRWIVRPSLTGRLEDRRYAASAVLWTPARIDARVRRDRRLSVGAALTVALGANVQLAARYELVQNSSTARGGCTGEPCQPLDRTDRSYRRQSIATELEASF